MTFKLAPFLFNIHPLIMPGRPCINEDKRVGVDYSVIFRFGINHQRWCHGRFMVRIRKVFLMAKIL